MNNRTYRSSTYPSEFDALIGLKKLTGTEWFYTQDECNALVQRTYPIIDKAFIAMLQGMNLEIECDFVLGEFTYDCAIPSQNVVIVFAHSLTHCTSIDVISASKGEYRLGLDKHYHREQALNAEAFGYECVHIFDWDDAIKLAISFMPKTYLPLSQCTIQQPLEEEAYLFLDMYHVRNHIDVAFDPGDVRLGLYHSDELIYLLMIGSPKYDKSYTAEIYRICNNPEYLVIGGWKQLLDCYIALYDPDSIIALRDVSKMYWKPYVEMGMKLTGYRYPRKYWSKGSERLTDGARFVNKLHPKRNTEYSTETQNLNTLLQLGWLPVFDCSSAIYEWRKEQS